MAIVGDVVAKKMSNMQVYKLLMDSIIAETLFLLPTASDVNVADVSFCLILSLMLSCSRELND